MKKFCIYNENNIEGVDAINNINTYKDEFLKAGFVIDKDNPEFVISFGGDGTLLRAEHDYPSIPKLFLKNTKVGKLAQDIKNEEIVKLFINDRYYIKSYDKLSAKIVSGTENLESKNIELIGSSEITLHNKDPRSAIRFHLHVDNDEIHHELIGDGIIVCNPLGSTGYYKAITSSFFEVGIGVAFNNTTEAADHMILKSDRKISIDITRGPAIIFAGNQDNICELSVGDRVDILSLENNKFNIIRVIDEVFEN